MSAFKAEAFALSFALVARSASAACDLGDEEFYSRQDKAELAACIAAGQDMAVPALMDETPLGIALLVGTDIDFVTVLWDEAARRGATVGVLPDGMTLFHRLAANGDAAMVQHFGTLLLDAGSDPSLPFGTLLGQDLSDVAASIPQMLINSGVDVDTDFATRLMQAYLDGAAFDAGSAATAWILLDGMSHADLRWLPALKLLLAAGADVNTASDHGFTPLMRFCNVNRREADPPENALLDLMLEHGADPRAATPDGDTALHRIGQSGNVAAAQRLVEAGADPLALTKDGQSILHWLAHNKGSPEMLRYFLSLGVDPDLRDNSGQTALDAQLAKADNDPLKDPDLIAILREASTGN